MMCYDLSLEYPNSLNRSPHISSSFPLHPPHPTAQLKTIPCFTIYHLPLKLPSLSIHVPFSSNPYKSYPVQ